MDRNPTMTSIIAVLVTTGIATLIPIADVMAQGNATAATNATSPQGNATAATNATSPHFIAKLTGESAVPPVTTNATGTAEFTVVGDGKTVQYGIDAENIDQVTDAYLAYSTGGRFIDIVQLRASVDDGVTGPINGPLVEGNFTQADFLERARNAVPEMTDLLKIVLDGNAYVRVHTVDNPLGEIVGRVTPNMPS
ncbi:MAG TPA: CHRD domain-containing protein [Nitrososphaeraceae archaeon]|jgi:hypothetical protein|nr:CHRD domain-containing protein [Nitrososphaeraceae archaeon]